MEPSECPMSTFLFPRKLWELVNDTKIGAITWNSWGNGIIVQKDLVKSQVLLLACFKASSFLSFVRQLHYYGFRKSKQWNRDKPNIHHFTHPNFIRNHPELLCLVKRCPRRHWFRAPAAVNTTAQPMFIPRYAAVGPPYFCNMPQMAAESCYVDPHPHPVLHPIPPNPNMFHLNRFVVSGFWDPQHNPMAPCYFNPYGFPQMGYMGITNQVPAPQPRAPVFLCRRQLPVPPTSISQTGFVKTENLSDSEPCKRSPSTQQPTDSVKSTPASQAGADAEEPSRDVGQLLLFLAKQGPIINALIKK